MKFSSWLVFLFKQNAHNQVVIFLLAWWAELNYESSRQEIDMQGSAGVSRRKEAPTGLSHCNKQIKLSYETWRIYKKLQPHR